MNESCESIAIRNTAFCCAGDECSLEPRCVNMAISLWPRIRNYRNERAGNWSRWSAIVGGERVIISIETSYFFLTSLQVLPLSIAISPIENRNRIQVSTSLLRSYG